MILQFISGGKFEFG